MIPLNPAAISVPQVQRRKVGEVYRVSQATPGGATSFPTKRILGMWVPGEAFRRGTHIRFTGQSQTASPIFRLSIGGNASAVNGGVSLTFSTGPAATCNFELHAIQEADGTVGPTFDFSGVFMGATSSLANGSSFAPFIQPLNYVEMNTSGTFTILGAVLEVIVPQWNARAREEILAT